MRNKTDLTEAMQYTASKIRLRNQRDYYYTWCQRWFWVAMIAMGLSAVFFVLGVMI